MSFEASQPQGNSRKIKPASQGLFGIDYDKITRETPTFISSQKRQKEALEKKDDDSGESSLQASDLMSGRTKASFVRKQDGKGFKIGSTSGRHGASATDASRTVNRGIIESKDTPVKTVTTARSTGKEASVAKKKDKKSKKEPEESDEEGDESEEEDRPTKEQKKKQKEEALGEVEVELTPEEVILAKRRRERLRDIQEKLRENRKVDPLDTRRHGLVCKLRNGHNLGVIRCQYARDGNHLLTGSYDRKAVVWDIKHQKIKRTYIGHSDMINDVQFSPDRKNTMVATASTDSTCRIWDKKSGKCKVTLSGEHRFAIYTLAWSSDGNQIATAGEDRNIVVWSLDMILKAKAQERRRKREEAISNPTDGAPDDGDDEDLLMEDDFVKNKMFGSPSNVHGKSSAFIYACWYSWISLKYFFCSCVAGHTGPIRRIVYFQKDTQIISCGDDSTIKFWQLNVSRGA